MISWKITTLQSAEIELTFPLAQIPSEEESED